MGGDVVTSNRDRLTRMVAGALRDCIAQHGPITSNTAMSAAKRIAGQLTSEMVRQESAAVEHLHSRIRKLRHGHRRALDQLAALRERLAEKADAS